MPEARENNTLYNNILYIMHLFKQFKTTLKLKLKLIWSGCKMAAQRVAAQQVTAQHVKWWYPHLSSELPQNNPTHCYHTTPYGRSIICFRLIRHLHRFRHIR